MSAYPPSPPAAARPRRRDRAGIWALLTFVVLSVACLALLVVAVSGGQLPNLRQPLSWTPSAEQASAAGLAQGEISPRFAPGAMVQNVSAGPVNLRQSPGFQNKPASDVLLAVPAGALGTVVGGPQELDGLSWWQVRFGEREGWMAERSSRGVALLDQAP